MGNKYCKVCKVELDDRQRVGDFCISCAQKLTGEPCKITLEHPPPVAPPPGAPTTSSTTTWNQEGNAAD